MGGKDHGKEQKPVYKKVWFWVLIVLALAGLGGAMKESGLSSSGNNSTHTPKVERKVEQSKKVEEKEKLTLEEGWSLDKETYATYVNGYVKNNTDKAITTYVQITFDALDKEGNNLGTCLANTNTIDASGKWKFRAICSGGNDIDKVRLKKITGV